MRGDSTLPMSAQAALALLTHALPHFTAIFAMTADGVRLYIDAENDLYYIEAPRGHTRAGLILAVIGAERHGYTPIPLAEDPGEFNEETGSHRIYLVQTVPAFATVNAHAPHLL